MSRTRRVLGGTALGYAHQAAILAVGLWLTPFLLGRLGAPSLGLWLVIGQILGYLALLDFGVVAILPREIAFASGNPDRGEARDRIGTLIARVKAIVRWQLPIIAIVCVLLWLLMPEGWQELEVPLALILIVFVVTYPARISLAVLQGAQDLTFLARIQIVAWAAGTATSVLLVMTGGGILSLAGGWAVTTALPALAALRRASRIYPAVPIQAAISSSRPYFQRSVWVSVGQIAQVLLNGSDVLVLGFVLGPAAVVAYSCTGKLVTVFANHPYMLMHGSQPAISELRGAGARDQLIRATTALTQAMLMMSGALVAVILPANLAFVSWWVGPAQYGGWTLSVAFAAMMLMRHCNVAVIYTLFCFGYERQLSLTSLADGVVCVAGAMVLIPWLGAAGAPLASVLGVMLVSLPLNLRGVARELGLSVAEFLAPSAELLKRLAIGTVAAAAAAYWLPGQSIVFSVMAMACVAGGYVLLIAPIAWNGPAGPYARTVLSAAQDRFACLARVEPALDRWLRPAGAGQP